MDTAPAANPATPAVISGPRAVLAPATPMTKPASETMPSLAPNTAARNRFSRPASLTSWVSPGWVGSGMCPWWQSAGDPDRRQAAGRQRSGWHPVGFGLAEHGAHRHDTGPHVEAEVLVIVLRASGADLRRRLVDAHRNDQGGRQLARVRNPRLGRTTGRDPFDQSLHRAEFLGGVGDRARNAEHYGAPVVHRVVERGTGQHQAVQAGDRHADLLV